MNSRAGTRRAAFEESRRAASLALRRNAGETGAAQQSRMFPRSAGREALSSHARAVRTVAAVCGSRNLRGPRAVYVAHRSASAVVYDAVDFFATVDFLAIVQKAVGSPARRKETNAGAWAKKAATRGGESNTHGTEKIGK